jgi:phospholipase D3/4
VVGFRIVQDTGFSPDFDSESAAIVASGRPNVQNRTLYVSDWWGGGVLHAKLWSLIRNTPMWVLQTTTGNP